MGALLAWSAAAAAAEDGPGVLSFDGTHAYPVGANAKGFSAGDCDGDGMVDLVAAGQGSNEVTILRNRGDRHFEVGGTRLVSQPTGAACADLNGDGLVDVAAASRLGTIELFHRTPAGDFTRVGSRPAGVAPASLTSGDVNGDGLVDLVAVATTSGDVTILLNTGSDALPPFARVTVPIATPQAAAIADFDRDGRVDIAVAGTTAPHVVILFGDGVGFAPRWNSVPNPFVQTRRPTQGRGVASGDLDGDGIPDLAVLSSASMVTLYRGTGVGTFRFLSAFAVPEQTEAIELADFDGDGLDDLGLLSSGTNAALVLHASAPGVFPVAAATPTREVLNGLGTASARTALLDPTDPTSTHTQVVIADSAGRALTIAEQTGLAAPSLAPVRSLAAPPASLVLADVTGDGVPDAIVSSRVGRTSTLEVLPANAGGGYDPLALGTGGVCGNGVLEPSETCDDGNRKARDGCGKRCTVELRGAVVSLFAADLDGDGRHDVVLLDEGGAAYGLFGDGAGRFSRIRLLAKVRRKTQLAVADFDGNGTSDVVVVPKSKRAGALALLANDGVGNFATTPIAFRTAVAGPLLAGDFDRNGLPDLLVAYKTGWSLLSNDGGRPERESGAVPTPKTPRTFAAGDFDEDGWLDVVVTFQTPQLAPRLFRGTVAGTFGGAEPQALDARALAPFIVDFDGDRHLDLMSCPAGAPAACRVHYGDGRGAFGAVALPSPFAFGREMSAAAAGDFDQDGVVDLVGTSYRDHTAVVLFQGPETGKVSFPAGTRPTDVAVVDLNGDGRLDFVVASEASRDLSIFVNLGGRRFTQPAPVRLPSVPDHSLGRIALAVGDINGDGTEDLAASQAGGTVTPLLNLNGGGLAALASLPTGARPWGVALGELNGDGTLDVVTANRDAGTFTVQLSGPNGTYTRTDYESGGLRPSDVATSDLNGDGRADVIVTNEKVEAVTTLGNVAVFLNDGNGGFGAARIHVRGRETPRSICAGDFDGDGLPDVAVASLESNDVMVLHGAGDGGWRADERDFPVGFGAVSVHCSDADGDGRTDVAYARKRAGDVGVVLTGE